MANDQVAHPSSRSVFVTFGRFVSVTVLMFGRHSLAAARAGGFGLLVMNMRAR
jgi:hypothetical protein